MHVRRSLALVTALLSLGACHHATSSGTDGGVEAISTSAGTTGGVPWVDVFVGSDDAHVSDPVSNGGSGATFPGAAAPFGMVQWSPDTPNASPPGYQYSDNQILGFSLTHLNGAGCPSNRDFPVLPVLGSFDPTQQLSVGFKHENEIASPGFYEVTLDNGVKVDLTATQRSGLARFTFPSAQDAKLLLFNGWTWDLVVERDWDAKIVSPTMITGYRTDVFCVLNGNTRVYFAAEFDRPFDSTDFWGGDNPSNTEVTSMPGGLVLGFDTRKNPIVHMKVGLSFVSVDNAIANLKAENPGWDFNAVHQQAIDTWNGYLNRIQIEGGTDDQKRNFYTALYHVFLQPEVFSDVDGEYYGFDQQVHPSDGHVHYANFSGWDIYRSWIQLVSLLAPKETSDIVRSLVDSGQQCGALPRWAYGDADTGVMVGDPSDAIIANAYAFGAQDFDTQAALTLMLHGANDTTAACGNIQARPDLVDYLAKHYCPQDGQQSTWGPPATTLEYAIADFSIAQFANALGKQDVASTFLARGRYWQNVFDPAAQGNGFSGYPEPRYSQDMNGMPAFREGDVGSSSGFVEGNPTQYTFLVPQDVSGLIAALGGDANMIERLDALFTQLNAGTDQPYFYMGNEPNFATPWEYPFAGAPWKTQEVVSRLVNNTFKPTPDGLPGNDDLGATSSWLVWGMLGMYPEVPGVGGFVLASPTFTRAQLNLENGKSFVILGDNASPTTPYVQQLTLNGQATTSTWLPVATVTSGGTLEYTLGGSPNMAWGVGQADRPPSLYQ